MSWVMVGAAGISTIGGIFGSKSAKKLQKESLALQRDALNFDKQRYDDYKNQYGGLIDLVIQDAKKGVDPNLGQVTSEAGADTATAFKNSQQALDNRNQRMGINPNSGRADAANRQLSLNQAIATAGNVTNARNTERKNASDTTWNRRYSVYQAGNSLISGAGNNVSNGMGSLANTYNQSANTQSGLANQAIAGGLSALTQGYLQRQQPTTTTVPVSSIADTTKGLKVAGTQAGSGVLYDNISSVLPNNTNQSFLG